MENDRRELDAKKRELKKKEDEIVTLKSVAEQIETQMREHERELGNIQQELQKALKK